MKRKLTLAMLLSISITSPMALAIGLGEVAVRSSLNAPLRASASLVDTTGVQPGLLSVSVAGERAYTAAGLERTPLAASVSLSVERRQGQLFIDFSTDRPVREPWLDLLLQLEWPSGQLVREVTLLLDPPNYDEMPALLTGSPRSVASLPLAEDRQPASWVPSRQVSAPRRGGIQVRSGDTLWGVAGRLRPDSGISMKQMMVALVAANPEAFPSGNVNAMRAGATLSIPDRDTIVERSPEEAERIVSAMNRAWVNRGNGAPMRVVLDATHDNASNAVADVAPGQIQASSADADSAAQAGPAAAREGAVKPRLILLTDAEVTAEQGLTTEVAVTAESSAESDGTTQRPAPELAGDDAASQLDIDPELSEVLHAESVLTEEQRLGRLEERWRQSQAQLEMVQVERDAQQAQLSDMRDELVTLRDQLSALTAGGAGTEQSGAGGSGGATINQQNTSWWGGAYAGAWDRRLMLGAAGLAVLLALWLVLRRRRSRGEARPSEASTTEVTIPSIASPMAASSSEASIAAGPLKAAAINEADIYIAYGRYDEAREMLEESLEHEPERDDLRLKLLWVYLELGSYRAAEHQAEKLRENDSPAMVAEAQHLMAQYGLAATAAGEARGERTDFDETMTGEMPLPAEEVAQAEPESKSEAESEHGAEPGTEPASPAAPELGQSLSLSDEAGRHLDNSGEVIDYHLPALDTLVTAREETPMHPSVELTSEGVGAKGADMKEGSNLGRDDAEGAGDQPLTDSWEVEEVSFPPLQADNNELTLSAAQHLIDTGDTGQARELLGELIQNSDPVTRDEALALLRRLDT